jgi:hypothetical protein
MYLSLPNIIHRKYIQQLREMFIPPSKNNVGLCKQIMLFILSVCIL